MHKAGIVLATAVVLSSGAVWAQDKAATPQEVVEKTKQAAQYLSKEGLAGLATFNRPQSDYVWADTYVFVVDCKDMKVVAHPITLSLVGQDITTLKDPTGMVFGPMLCQGEASKGHWVEYHWPKPGQQQPSRKLSYMEPVPNTPYRVGAGVYDDTLSLADLEKISGG